MASACWCHLKSCPVTSVHPGSRAPGWKRGMLLCTGQQVPRHQRGSPWPMAPQPCTGHQLFSAQAESGTS